MDELISIQQISGRAMTTSIEVAKRFGKRHDNVLRDIDALLEEISRLKSEECNPLEQQEFSLLNFEESEYLDQRGKKQKMYYMDRTAFSTLAMRFTGRKALFWQIRFAEAYEKMEKFIIEHHLPNHPSLMEWGQARLVGKQARRDLTDVIKEYLIPSAILQGSKNYKMFYLTYTKMLNKSFVEDTGFQIPKPGTVRDYLDVCDLVLFKKAEDKMAKMIQEEIAKDTHYKDIYKICQAEMFRWVDCFGKFYPSLPAKSPVPKLLT